MGRGINRSTPLIMQICGSLYVALCVCVSDDDDDAVVAWWVSPFWFILF